ncbi:MAG: PAS domain S-box protein [Opitutae bacterium]|nr:PAS domain S-box protein [Opitutae bacterium]
MKTPVLPRPWSQFARLLALVFAVELVVMLAILQLGLGYSSKWLRALLDATVLTLLVAPFFWWWVVAQGQRRRCAELALQKSESKFRRLFEGSADALLLLELGSGRFIDCNQAAADMLDYPTPEDVLNLRPADLSPPFQPDGQASEAKAPLMIARAVEAGSHRFEWIHCSARRADFPVEVLLTPIQLEGQRLMMTTWRDLSAHKQAEAKLQLRSAALQAAANAVLITDRHGTVEWVNAAFTALTGYSLAEAIGRNPGDLLRSGHHDAAYFKDLWDTILAGRVWKKETINRRKDGSLFTELQTITPVRSARGEVTHFIAIKEDITHRKQAETRLREQAEVIDKSPVAIVITDLAHRVTYCNEGARQLYGLSEAELLGHTADELLSPGTMRALGPGREATLATGAWRGIVPIETRNGRRLTAEFIMSLIRDEDNKPLHRLSIALDVTEKKQMELHVQHMQRLENLGMLAAGIAHDMNNILAPIIMAAPLLKSRITDERGQRILNTVEKSGERGAALVRQLISFAHGSSDAPALLQVRHVLKDIAEMIDSTFPKSIRLETALPGDLWPVTGSATQLHQVFLNLCINARDAMPHGGILRLGAANRRLTEAESAAIPDARPGSFVVVTVADTGTGIPPEILARVWEPFFTTKAPDKGTGLGLSTVRGLIAGHHGFITLDSHPGRGTVFTAYLPADEVALSRAERPATATPVPRGQGELILVVDDEKFVRELVTRVLEDHGYRVLAAGDGAEAVARFFAHSAEVQLLLTDLMMPLLGGQDLVTEVLRLRPGLPVICMSGMGSGGREGLSSFITAFVAKPFDIPKLLGTVRAALQRPPARDALARP